MQTWIALLRGINVGGKNKLAMADLRRELEALGFERVRTYIQSGNVVLESTVRSISAMAKKIADRVELRWGFRPYVLVLSLEAIQQAIDANPWREGSQDPDTVYLYFLAGPVVDAKLRALEVAKSPTEQYVLTDRVLYLYAPEGVGRSKLAANVEKFLGVTATARNMRTVEAIRAMVEASD